jgi:conjugative transfer region protein TrbK
MGPLRIPCRIAWITAAGFIVVIGALAAARDRHGEPAGVVAPREYEQVEARDSELARCRAVTLDQSASLERCRQIWAANRRQFFTSVKTPSVIPRGNPAKPTASRDDLGSSMSVDAEHQPGGTR